MNLIFRVALAAMLSATVAIPAQAWMSMNGAARNGSDANGIGRNGVDAPDVVVLAMELPPESE